MGEERGVQLEADRRASEMTSRHYSARLRAMEASRGPRARSESIYESRGFGSPDYRSSSIEISTGRLNKRVINVTSVHSNDKVPLYLDGTYGRSVTVVRDTYSPVPNLSSYPSAIGTQGQGYRVTSSLGSPYTGGYRYAYGTTSNSSLLAPARYRTPSPVRYSVQP